MLDALMWTNSRLVRNDTELKEMRSGAGREYVGRAHAYQTGYVREIQVRRMVELVRAPGMARYCEVGMNGGHSAVAMLLANTNVTVEVFDIMNLKYSWPVAQVLKAGFGDRFVLHPGKSGDTLPQWTTGLRANGSHCDLVLVDGSHDASVAGFDLRQLRRAATPRTRLVVDDINMPPGRALAKEVERGRIQVLEQYGPFARNTRINPCMRTPPGVPEEGVRRQMRAKYNFMCPRWGFAVGRFVGTGET